MKINLQESQSPLYHNDAVEGVEFVVREDCVFIQIGNYSIRVERDELSSVLTAITK